MKVPSISELQQLISVVPARAAFGLRDRAIMVLLANTGLRVSELAGLDVFHVFWQGVLRAFLEVPRAWAKGAHGRTVPLNANAHKAIRALLAFNRERGFATDDGSPLIQDRFHRRIPVRSIQRMIQHYRELAGVSDRITPHKFRHFFACQTLQKTGNVRITQVLLGHWRLDTVEVYTHYNQDQLMAAVGAG